MELKITRDVDKLLLYFTFLEMLFLRWVLIGQDTILLCSCIFILFRLFFARNRLNRRYKNVMYLFIVLLIYIFLSSFVRQDFKWDVLTGNLYYMFLPAVWIMYFGYLISCRPELVESCFDSLRKPLNIYYIINFVIILMQRGETYFLMPVDKIENAYYEDHLAGLLGIEGTHRLALFTVFVILLNFRHIIREIRNGKIPTKSIVYMIIVIATAIYTSSMNDNNMLFLLIPFFLLAFYMYTPGSIRGKFFNVLLLLFAVFVFLYFVSTNSYIANVLGSRIGKVIGNIQETISGNSVEDERAIYLVYVMSQMNGWFLGVGFGSVQMRFDPSIVALGYNYRNWGMSDISPFIAMGGVVFYLGIILFYCNILFSNRWYKRERKYTFVIMLVLTYYHQVLTHSTMTIPMCWIIALFALQDKYNKKTTEDDYPLNSLS